MKKSDNQRLIKRNQQIQRKIRIITYISLLTFGVFMIISGFHTVFQTWEQAQKPSNTPNTRNYNN